MKKLLSFTLTLTMILALAVPAFADVPGFTDMTTDEIMEIINAARNELISRELKAAENTILLDQNDVQIYLTGKHSVDSYDEYVDLYLEVVVVNNTGRKINVDLDSITVNGWDVDAWGIYDVSSKKKDDLEIDISDADLSSYDELEDIVFTFEVYDSESYETIFIGEPVVVTFGSKYDSPSHSLKKQA